MHITESIPWEEVLAKLHVLSLKRKYLCIKAVLQDSENGWKEDKIGLYFGLIQQGQGIETFKNAQLK